MNTTNKWLPFLAFGALIFTSCSNDDDNPDPVHEEEVITTLTITLTPDGGGTEVTLQSRDLDGNGPNEPEITITGNIVSNTTYNGSIELLNETEDPAEDITEEVDEEDEEHQFFYALTGELGTITYTDTDDDGNPVGLLFTWETADAANGTLTATLRHEPNKDAEGVSDGEIANAGGETDITQTFTINVVNLL